MRLLQTNNISALSSCLVFLLLLGWSSANTCNLVSLFTKGVCRLGKCLNHEYSIPGSSLCDVDSLLYANFYVRCFDRQPCCSRGGYCKLQCGPGEVTLNDVTDCGAVCCVPGNNQPFFKPSNQLQQGACGSAHALHRRVVGGAIAQPTDWPWMVRILYPQNTIAGICSGVLVDDDTVLTVAHCVYGYSSSDLRVLLGDYDMTIIEPEEEVVGVRNVETNPNYQVEKLGNDLAVLKLDRAVTFNPRKLPACLPDPNVPVIGWDMATGKTRDGANTQCYIAGWGHTENGVVSTKLRSARVSLMDRSTCEGVLSALQPEGHAFSHLPSDVICTDASTLQSSTCRNDDGGMLVCLDEQNRYTLLGLIVPHWQSCGKFPALYTQISKYTAALLTRL